MKKALLVAWILAVLTTACKRGYATEPVPPDDDAACTNSASFIEDVTFPDNTSISPGKEFKKTWRVMNSGTCTWNKDYHLVFAKNDQMGAPDATPLKVTRPGEEIDISVEMRAPIIKGTYRGDFQLLDPSGTSVPIDNGQYIWVIISVDIPE